ncbi:MAG: alpha/beta hydrolase [Actinomycetota bacterium]
MRSTDLGFVHRYIEGSDPTTLLLLHGTGGNEDDLLPLGKRLLPDAHLLSPRGKVLENGMPRFFRRLAMGVFDIEDLKTQTHALAEFIDEAAQRYDLDRDEIIAVGYSNGANIAASLLLLHPHLLRRAGLLHAMLPFEPDVPPDLSQTSVLLTGARRDPYISPEQTEALGDLLRACGAQLTMEWQPAGHELTPAEVEALSDWIS